MAEYLVKDFTKEAGQNHPVPVISIVRDNTLSREGSLWAVLQDAKDGKRKVAIYQIGECLLDWS